MNSAADWYAEQEYRERCGMPHEGESMPKQKISNADRIRQMTDEELAEWLTDGLEPCNMCASEYCCGMESNCVDGVLLWLIQEVDQK